MNAGIDQSGSDYVTKYFPPPNLWHLDDNGLYWCGDWYHRTPKQLLDECTTTIRDLIMNHPELLK
jgi:hypothetical protein